MRKTDYRLAWLPVVACCVLVLSGCGGAKERYAIKGTVTLDGKPLEKGQVCFVPLQGTKGPTAGAEIVDGKFSIPNEGGTFLGKFRVEVTASRPTKKKMPDPITGRPAEVYEQFIPEKYNKRSELEAEVQANGPNDFEFSVTSK